LQFFQDAVLEFSGGQKASLSSFLEWWEETGRYRSVIVSEQQDAMKIVTLHKSKGLQYNVVIMPYCSWTLEADPTKNNILWCGSAKPPFDRFPGLPVRFSSTLKNSFYSREYYREMLMSYTDNLNLLYVAFTRAVDRLYVFAPFPRANKDGSFSLKRVNDLIFQSRQLISGPAQRITETAGSLVIEQGPEGADRPAGVPVTDTGSYTLRSFPVSDWRHRLSIAAKSPDLFVETASPSALKINYGIIMHRVLSEIAAPADIPGVLENLCHEGLISSSEKRELNGKLDVLFGMELVFT
jgi:ATP-dependent helicase/nuclease subunit A